tara:strand:- start:716 stop:1267 length:552 start_codon:yes stop_codon:yes gene_type:complete
MSKEVSQDDLLAFLRWWVRPRLLSFPRWEFDEIINEGYEVCMSLLPSWDPDKGSYITYLKPRLYDYLIRKYRKVNGITTTRYVGGKIKTRAANKREYNFTDLGYIPGKPNNQPPPPSSIPWDRLTPKMRDLVLLLSRGYTQRQASRIMNVHESATTKRIKRIREHWNDIRYTSHDGTGEQEIE